MHAVIMILEPIFEARSDADDVSIIFEPKSGAIVST